MLLNDRLDQITAAFPKTHRGAVARLTKVAGLLGNANTFVYHNAHGFHIPVVIYKDGQTTAIGTIASHGVYVTD